MSHIHIKILCNRPDFGLCDGIIGCAIIVHKSTIDHMCCTLLFSYWLSRLSDGQLVAMATDAASGLAYLERVGYIHTDVAARNCVVSQDLTVKITGKSE